MSLYRRAMRAGVKIWGAYARPRYRMQIGGRSLRISATHEDARGLINWSADWKSDAIARILRAKPGAFLDVGANIGQTMFCYLASQTRGGYVGFEPSARCLDHLNTLIRDNALDDCAIAPVALSNAAGLIRIHVASSVADASATMLPETQPDDRTWSYLAPAFRYDDIAGELPLKSAPALVKIDAEGAEPLILQGMQEMLRAARPWIMCEVLTRHPNADTDRHARRCRELMAFLKSIGYPALRMNKAPDLTVVESLTPVEAFPEVVYTEENKEQCYYMFVPEGDVQKVSELFAT